MSNLLLIISCSGRSTLLDLQKQETYRSHKIDQLGRWKKLFDSSEYEALRYSWLGHLYLVYNKSIQILHEPTDN